MGVSLYMVPVAPANVLRHVAPDAAPGTGVPREEALPARETRTREAAAWPFRLSVFSGYFVDGAHISAAPTRHAVPGWIVGGVFSPCLPASLPALPPAIIGGKQAGEAGCYPASCCLPGSRREAGEAGAALSACPAVPIW